MTTEHPCTGTAATERDGGTTLLRCATCGAYQRINPESGNVTWIRAGRVISAPQDMKDAQERHDMRWPDSPIGAG